MANPEETLARLMPLCGPCGITRLADVTGLDHVGLPVVQAVRPNSRSSAVAMGKGLDLVSARVSAIVEALESWHAEQVAQPLRLARWTELRRDGIPVVDLAWLPRHAARVREPNAILWIEGRELSSGDSRWVPLELVHADDTLELPGGGTFPAGTNGLAGGNHPLEARLHALCELIERDATALWFHAGRHRRASTALDLTTVTDPDAKGVLSKIGAAGLSVAVWSTTSDVGVPSFLAVMVDPRDPTAHPGMGAGCHPAKDVALLRALLEAAQVRLAYISGARDDIAPADYTVAAVCARAARAGILVGEARPNLNYGDLPSIASDDLVTDAELLLASLREVGLSEIIEVDLTRDEIGLPVVRLVAPGLEGPLDHPGYRPGPRASAVGVGQ